MPRPHTRVRRAACTRRAAAGSLLALAAVLLAAGCARFDAALGKQWVVIDFKADTTTTTARQVLSACGHVPHLHPEPLQHLAPGDTIVESARFGATYASDADMARLQECLQRFPSVQGWNLTQPGDS